MPVKRVVVLATLGVVALLVCPAIAAAATGNDVGANLSKLLRHYAGELYGGVIAVVSLMFLINRRYGELATFLLASVVVAWLVFSPDQVANAARSIGNQIF
jgi:uncharacterized membrane protein YccC